MKSGSIFWQQIGRIVIGLALMILSLGLIVGASQPLRDQGVFTLVMQRLADDPMLALLLGALITWVAHSSVAVILFVMSLAAAGALGLPLALALVLQNTFPSFGDSAAVILFGVVGFNECIAPPVLRVMLLRSGEAGKKQGVDFAADH